MSNSYLDDLDYGSAQMSLIHPVFVMKNHYKCWECKGISGVYGIAASGVYEDDNNEDAGYDDFLTLSNVSDLNENLAKLISLITSNFKIKCSSVDGNESYVNHCQHCGIEFDDHVLHSHPSYAFFPVSEDEGSLITLFQLPDDREYILGGSQSMQMPCLISHFGMVNNILCK